MVEKLYTIKEASKMLRLGEQSIRRRIHEGEIKAYNLGGYKISESEINRFFEESRVKIDDEKNL